MKVYLRILKEYQPKNFPGATDRIVLKTMMIVMCVISLATSYYWAGVIGLGLFFLRSLVRKVLEYKMRNKWFGRRKHIHGEEIIADVKTTAHVTTYDYSRVKGEIKKWKEWEGKQEQTLCSGTMHLPQYKKYGIYKVELFSFFFKRKTKVVFCEYKSYGLGPMYTGISRETVYYF